MQKNYWEERLYLPTSGHQSDARDYRLLGIPTIQFGPSNTVGIHSYNETVQIQDVVTAAKTYIGAICDLMGGFVKHPAGSHQGQAAWRLTAAFVRINFWRIRTVDETIDRGT
jgi:hypothetical protein